MGDWLGEWTERGNGGLTERRKVGKSGGGKVGKCDLVNSIPGWCVGGASPSFRSMTSSVVRRTIAAITKVVTSTLKHQSGHQVCASRRGTGCILRSAPLYGESSLSYTPRGHARCTTAPSLSTSTPPPLIRPETTAQPPSLVRAGIHTLVLYA
jgi:hypothetical protein